MTTIQDKCECYHPLYVDFDFLIVNNSHPCNLTTDCKLYFDEKVLSTMQFFAAPDFGCVTETVGNIDKGNIACGCHVECFEEDYTVSLSTSLWPSNQYFVS